MKIAVLGGSFNPLHNGHIFLAEAVLKEFDYDKIFFVPTFIPPHKEIISGVSALRRFEMTKLFCETEKEHFIAEDCEIKRGGLSYTFDTLQYFFKKYKSETAENKIEGKIGLIMGEEIAAEFNKWKNPFGICEIADLIIAPRKCDYLKNHTEHAKNKPVKNYCGDFNKKFSKETFVFPFKMLNNPVAQISSTEIRRRILKNIDFKDLVPLVVYDYIKTNKLYLSENV